MALASFEAHAQRHGDEPPGTLTAVVPRQRNLLHLGAIGLLVLNMAYHGIGKLAGRSGEVAAFERWGYTPEFRLLIGALETAAAIGLLIPRLRAVTLGCIALLMVGATKTHIENGEWTALWLPAVTTVLAVVAFLTRPLPGPALK